jgi:hypothetical protein
MDRILVIGERLNLDHEAFRAAVEIALRPRYERLPGLATEITPPQRRERNESLLSTAIRIMAEVRFRYEHGEASLAAYVFLSTQFLTPQEKFEFLFIAVGDRHGPAKLLTRGIGVPEGQRMRVQKLFAEVRRKVVPINYNRTRGEETAARKLANALLTMFKHRLNH